MKSLRKQRGYTLVEVVFLLWFIICMALAGTGIYVAFHFLSKFW